MKRVPALLAHLQSTLSGRRYAHTLAVAHWAKKLAMMHNLPAEKAWRAGLLHDLAKETPGRTLAKYMLRHRLSAPDSREIIRRRQFGLFHAYVSAHRAAKEFGEKDKAVLSAVAAHTLGRAAMAPLDKVLYIADFSAQGRDHPSAAQVRRAARRDLDEALKLAVGWKMRYVLERGGYLNSETVKLWNSLAEKKRR